MNRRRHPTFPFGRTDDPQDYTDLHAALRREWARAEAYWQRIKLANAGHAATVTKALPGMAAHCRDAAQRLHDPALRSGLIAMAARLEQRMTTIEQIIGKPPKPPAAR